MISMPPNEFPVVTLFRRHGRQALLQILIGCYLADVSRCLRACAKGPLPRTAGRRRRQRAGMFALRQPLEFVRMTPPARLAAAELARRRIERLNPGACSNKAQYQPDG
jgi:hypothetical protein